MTTVLLHGFWGQPSDWNGVIQELPLAMPVLVPDLYAPGPLAPTTPLKDWAAKFWHWLEHEVGESPVQLVGYSMGARLALCAAMVAPQRVARALFISGRPLLKAVEGAGRLEMEKRFAADFLREDWATLESRWQEQSVFTHSKPVPRRHSSELREALGLSLANWSPRLHVFGAEQLKSLPARMEWAFGALDQNYLEVAKDLQELPVRGQITLIPNVGHRIISEAPAVVGAWIKGVSDAR